VPKRSGVAPERTRSSERADQLGRDVEQALLEEPQAVADFVDHARPVRTHLVRLPQRGHLLGDRRLDPRPARPRVVEPVKLLVKTDLRGEDGPAGRFGRMRGQHKIEREPPRGLT
jgi:hypothetical protein